ncbi:MAG: PBP1A family penicillin-binding protein [Pseudomonadota bacterium]
MMRWISILFQLGVYGFFAGLLMVVTVFWWHGRDLQSTAELAQYQPATLSRVYAADGDVIGEFARERRLFTPIDEVPELVKQAFISAEDRNFYNHAGVDWVGFAKAMVDNVYRYANGRRLRGASTITMQVVKNFLLSGDREISRKIKELLLAQRLESAVSKEKVLELYLNEIFLGSNAYGVTSAADRYFDKRLEDLTIAEAAYLAALPKAPSRLHPVRHKEYATERRDYVLKEMRENGYIDRDQYQAAIDTPLLTEFDKPDEAILRLRGEGGIDYFAEEVFRQLVDQRGVDQVMTGGLAVRSTMESDMQEAARLSLQSKLWEFSRNRGYGGPAAQLADLDPTADPLSEAGWRRRLAELEIPRDIQGWRPAVVLSLMGDGVEIGVEGADTGASAKLPFADVSDWARRRTGVDAQGDATLGPELRGPGDVWTVGDVIYVSRDAAGGSADGGAWSMRQIPDVNGALVALDPRTGRVLALQGGFSHDASKFNRATQARRQPGSAFKPFVYAAALEHGYKPNSLVLDAPITLEQPDGDLWRPRNYSGRFYGSVPLRWGIEKSHNLMTVRVAMDVGLETVAEYAETFGVYKDMPPLVSYALGAGETTLLKLTASYAMFANGGKRIEPSLIDRIQDRWGETVFRHDKRVCLDCRAEAYDGAGEPYVPDEGEQVINPITAFQIVSMMEGVTVRGTATSVGRAFEFPVAGKTGTTNLARDAWFVGFTNDLVVGCFVGFDTPAPLGRKMSGGKVCGPIFTDFVEQASELRAPGPFRLPPEVVLVKIDRNSGCVVPSDRDGRDFIWEPFSPETAPYVGQCPEGGIGGRATTAREAELRTIPQEFSRPELGVGPVEGFTAAPTLGGPTVGVATPPAPQATRPETPFGAARRTVRRVFGASDLDAAPPPPRPSAGGADPLDALLQEELDGLGLGDDYTATPGRGRQPDPVIGGGTGGLY